MRFRSAPRREMKRCASFVLAGWLCLLAPVGQAQDAPGAVDPLGLVRDPGARIIHVVAPTFAQYKLDLDAGWGKTEILEGDFSRTVYLAPSGQSNLAAFRYYQKALVSVGFKKQLEIDGASTIDSYFFDQYFFGPETYNPSDPSSLYNLVNNALHPYYSIYKGTWHGKSVTVVLLTGLAKAMEYREPGVDATVGDGQVFAAIDLISPQ